MSAVLAVVLMVLKIIGMILLALLLLLLLALLLPAGIHFRWSHIGGLRLQLCYGPLHFTLYPRKADEEKKKAEPKAETKQGNTPKNEPTSAAPPKPTPPPAKAPEEPQKAEPAPPAEKEQGKPKAPETSPQPEQAVPKPKAKSAPASQPGAAAAHAPAAETPAAEPQPEKDTGLVDRIKAAVRADPVGYVRHLFSVLRASVGPLLRGFRVSKLNVIWTITGETAAETAILYGQTLTTLNTILAIAQDHIKIQADQLWLEADYTGSAKQQRVVSLKLLLCPLLALVTVVCFVWHARHDPQLLPPKHPKYNTPETEQGGNL
jgi:pistil-specific extensin-like protein